MQTEREDRGSCRRHHLELSPRISSEERRARGLAGLQTTLIGFAFSSSATLGKVQQETRAWELHDKPGAEFEAQF